MRFVPKGTGAMEHDRSPPTAIQTPRKGWICGDVTHSSTLIGAVETSCAFPPYSNVMSRY